MAIVASNHPDQHAAAVASENLLQNDLGSARADFLATGSSPKAYPAYEAAVKAATIAHYTRLKAAAVANGLSNSVAEFSTTLRDLGK